MGFVIPLLAMVFVGGLYVLISRTAQNGASFILATAAAGLAIYWVFEIYRMSRPEGQKKASREQMEQQKGWVYDLIRNSDGMMVFVAEVPGPEEQIDVRLTPAGVLRIKGGQNFAKDVQLTSSAGGGDGSAGASNSNMAAAEMGISDYKYRNGVLTIKIQKI